MLSSIIASVLEKLASWFMTKVLDYINGKREQAATNDDIDATLAALKEAYKESYDGTPPTDEKKAKMEQAIRDFIRNTTPGRL